MGYEELSNMYKSERTSLIKHTTGVKLCYCDVGYVSRLVAPKAADPDMFSYQTVSLHHSLTSTCIVISGLTEKKPQSDVAINDNTAR